MKRFLSIVLALVVAFPILVFPLASPVAAQGYTWTLHTDLDDKYKLHDVWRSSPTDVWAVGEDDDTGNGVVFHYTGSGWTPVPISANLTLYGIWGTSSSDIYAVGGDGVFSYNGSSWNVISCSVWDVTPLPSAPAVPITMSGEALRPMSLSWGTCCT